MSDGKRIALSQKVHRAARRRGTITLWTVLCIPLLLTILWSVVEVGCLWQARTQAENALEAAALAAVQTWGERGGKQKNLLAARFQGNAFAKANTVGGVASDLDNPEAVSSVAWSFGSATQRGSGFDFTENQDAADHLAVVLQATVRVPRHSAWLAGASTESSITATTAAIFDPSDKIKTARLIRLNAPREFNGNEDR